ncbi:MAG TPA: CvpA family protein [Candidatus Sulfotelmatobacter sp.]|nr:CvpA family protein [Candidatus Sulfotelmatobacter sp.]
MDVILIGFIGGYIYAGFRTGFLKRLLGIVFMVVSFLASAYFRYPVGAIASTFFKDIPSDYANLVGYAIAFPAILAGLHLASHLILGKTNVHGLVAASTDKILGAILGGVEAVLIVSAGIVILDTYFGTGSTLGAQFHAGYLKDLTQAVNGSETVKLLRDTTVPFVLAILGPLLPKDIGTIVPTGLPGRLPFPTTP